MKQPDKRTPFLFITLGIVTILLLLIDMATGDTYIPITKVWAVLTGGECDEMTRNILLSIRFIRVVVAALIGIALSVSGLQMQTVFQNPLADPYLLGVSSGAGLGVALFILGAPLLGWAEFPILQSLGIVGSGWIGTAIILLGVAIISRKVKNILGVLIMGVIAFRWMKVDFGSVAGMLCGSMANPMALNYVNDTIPGDNPSVSYATVYPLCMFLRVIIAQVLLMFFLS